MNSPITIDPSFLQNFGKLTHLHLEYFDAQNSFLIPLPLLKSLTLTCFDDVDVSQLQELQSLELSGCRFTPLTPLNNLNTLKIVGSRTKIEKLSLFFHPICEI